MPDPENAKPDDSPGPLPDPLLTMPDPDRAAIGSLDKLYRNYYGTNINAVETTIPTSPLYSPSYQPEYWIIRVWSLEAAITGMVFRRDGGDDTTVDLPASITGVAGNAFQERRFVLPGSARLVIVDPSGTAYSYTIAAVRGYDPDKVF